jgi:hypothetical protein
MGRNEAEELNQDEMEDIEVEDGDKKKGKKGAKDKKEKLPRKPFLPNFIYFFLEIKLLREMLGTCCEPSIYTTHVLRQARIAIREANALSKKITKALDKFLGTEQISEMKEIAELQGAIRRYQELLGRKDEVPNEIEALLEYAKELQSDFDDLIDEGKQIKATFFMRSKDGKPMVSTHMIVGNLKENLRIITNNTTLPVEQKAAPSKVSVGEMLALDVKPVEEFMFPDHDVDRNPDGTPRVLVRPLKFDRKGVTTTALSASEVLPVGTEMRCNVRVRIDSPMVEVLQKLFDLGKSNGLGAWRGSGSKGQYCYRFTQIDKDPTPIPEGWC